MVDGLIHAPDLVMHHPDLLRLVLSSFHMLKVLILVLEFSWSHIINLD